jgi:hypothetical protein
MAVDLTLTSLRGVWIEPSLDPGHGDLELWYETPEGEIRRYRPALNFCRNPRARVLVSSTSPLHHNPRIHLDRHGLVFEVPGVYRLWAIMNARSRTGVHSVRSNNVSFELRLPRNDTEVEISETLRRTDIAKTVANGGGLLSSRSSRLLASTLRRHFTHPSIAPVRYQLAKRSIDSRRYDVAREYLAGLRLSQPSLARGAQRLRTLLRQR